MKPRRNGRSHDAEIIRRLLVESIGRCKLDRRQIANAVSTRIGLRGLPFLSAPLTLRMLNGYTAESCQDYRFPMDIAIAFCEVTGDYRLLREIVKRAGFRMVDPEEEKLIALGKAVVAKAKAERTLAAVQP